MTGMEWLILAAWAVEVGGILVGMNAADKAADYEEYNASLQAGAAELQAEVSATNRLIDLRYNLELNQAALTAGVLGEGEDFLAMRRHQQEIARRDLRAIELGGKAQSAGIQARASLARQRADNAQIAGLFGIASATVSGGTDFYVHSKSTAE